MFWKESASDPQNVRSYDGMHDGSGKITSRWLFRGLASTSASLFVWDVEPGASEGNHVHEANHNYEELYYFVHGEGVMTIDDQEVPVVAGDAVLAPVGVDHGFRNTGPSTMRVLIMVDRPSKAD